MIAAESRDENNRELMAESKNKPTRYAVRWAVNEPSSASVGTRRDPLGISELADIAHRIIILRVRPPFIEVLVQKYGCHQAPTLQAGLQQRC